MTTTAGVEDGTNMESKLGKQLKVGDTIKVWWHPDNQKDCRDTITRLVKYDGPLAYLWPEGAKLAYFMGNRAGMTIANADYYEVC